MHVRSRILPLVFITFLLFTLIACTPSYRVVEINTSSMEPNYPEGTRLRIVEIDPTDLERGDLVYFEGFQPDKFNVKRLIGLPGETVEFVEGVISIDGTLIEEDYQVIPQSLYTGTWILAEDEYFLVGDNRPSSADSRSYGPIHASAIVGIALPTE